MTIKNHVSNIISLVDARLRASASACQHKKILVDKMLTKVSCGDCNKELNPVEVLQRMAHEESYWKNQGEAYTKVINKLKEKTRCKCEHCGKVTRIANQ